MIKVIGRLCYLMGCLLSVTTPFIAKYASANNTLNNNVLSNDGLRNMVTTYSYFLLIIASVFFLIVGSVVGYFYPTPKYGVKPYPKWLKLLISMGGGVLAFIYYIATKKDIHSVVIIWVACISFVSPAIIHLVHAGIIKFVMGKANLTEDDVKQIVKSFGDREK